MRREQRVYSVEDREAILAAVHAGLKLGKSVKVTSREHGITESTFYRWERERAWESKLALQPPARPRPAQPSRTYCNREDRERLIPQIRQRLDAGATVKEAARAVGVSAKSWYRWMRMAAAEPESSPTAFRPVELTSELAVQTSGLSLLTPGGYRVEGLSVETAIQLLRALG